MTLSDHLNACAKDSGLRILNSTPAHLELRNALRNDPAILAEARTLLATIDPETLLRDHITRWRKATLEAALP